jgi:tetratricopeptide (TPR) repeat protein
MTKISIAYKAQGKYRKALKTLFKLLEIRPEDSNIFFEIGNAYTKMGQSESAWENYLKARMLAAEGSQMVVTLDLALADISYDIWHKRKGMELLAKAKTYNAKALETYPAYLVISRRLEKIEKLLRGQIQILKVETRSRKKYQEIVKQIRQKSSLADLRHIVKKYPKWTQITYIYPHKLNDELQNALDTLEDGESSQVIQRKRKYIGIYRITSADGGKNR